MSETVYLSAREAATELGVRPATLYAYVSRGLIRSVPGPGKQHRYDAADVRRLQARKEPSEPSGTRPLTGEAVLDTQLTLISEDGPYYRGCAATDLARSSTLESVATLLWNCETDPFAGKVPDAPPVAVPSLGPIDRLMMAMAAWPSQDKAAYTLSPVLLQKKGASLLRYGVAALLRIEPGTAPIHDQFAIAWSVRPELKPVIRATLVLAADHELNTSAFAVRCAASTRAPLHAAVLSGLGAFSGPRHGTAADRTTAWLQGITSSGDIEPVLASRLTMGESLPGFGHSVYRDRDPRADCLIEILAEGTEPPPFVSLIPEILEMAETLFGLRPNIDFALASAQRALDLPPDAAKTLFCAGRIVGWIAHALEQYQAPGQIRPRATYVGERPKTR